MKGVLLILAMALVLGVITYLLSLAGFFPWINHYLINIAFLIFLTIVVDQINQRALDQEGRGIIIPYLVAIILKLIFSAVFLVLFVRENVELARGIVFSFLAYYVAFTTSEIVIVNKRLRLKKS